MMLLPVSLPDGERPVTDVPHQPAPDRHVDVNVHAAERSRGSTPFFGVTQGPAAKGQVAVCRTGDPEIPGVGAELVRGVRGGTRAHPGNMPTEGGVASRVACTLLEDRVELSRGCPLAF